MELKPVMALVLASALCGCSNFDGERGGFSSRTRDSFGEALREARVRQTLDPAASLREAPPEGIDAQAAVSAWRRYQGSFREPPPAFEVLGIGSGLR